MRSHIVEPALPHGSQRPHREPPQLLCFRERSLSPVVAAPANPPQPAAVASPLQVSPPPSSLAVVADPPRAAFPRGKSAAPVARLVSEIVGGAEEWMGAVLQSGDSDDVPLVRLRELKELRRGVDRVLRRLARVAVRRGRSAPRTDPSPQQQRYEEGGP